MSYDISILNIPPVVPPVNEIEYQIDDGAIIPIAAAIDDYPVGFLPPGTYANRIRGKNLLGTGPWSNNKTKIIDWDDIFAYYGWGQGWVYDMSRMDTMWQDHTQTNPVTDYGQTVGYQLDLSGNGNHRNQSSVASRPIYGRHPASGIRNLSLGTNPTSIVTSTNVPRITTDTLVGIDYGVFQPDAGTEIAPATGAVLPPIVRSGVNQYLSWYVRPMDYTQLGTVRSSTVFPTITITWDFSTGIPVVTAGTPTNVVMQNLGSGVWRCGFGWSAAANTSASTGVGYRIASVSSADSDGVKTFAVGGIQTELGSVPTAFQRVGATRWDITESGSPDCFFIAYDGINDGMQSVSTVNLSATDEITAIIAQRRERNNATQVLLELGATVASNDGTFALLAPDDSGANSYRFSSRGTTRVDAGTGTFANAANDRSVITGRAKISDPLVQLYRNGTLVEQSTASQGAGNFANATLNSGRRNNASDPFAGREYFSIGVDKIMSAITREQIERYVGSKAGVSW